MTSDTDVKNVERGNWSGKLDFFMSCVGYAVGLGNVWRFPYLCFRNGGGAFIIPYVVMLILAGLPLFFFELSLGQFASLGPISIWRVNPLFKGVGFASVLISGMVAIYYQVIICYAMFYTVVSLTSLDGGLPWMDCHNPWNTPACAREAKHDFRNLTDVQKLNVTLNHMDHTCINKSLISLNISHGNLTYDLLKSNLTSCNDTASWRLVSPSEEYWTRFVLRLQEADDFRHVGDISLKLAFVLGISWIILFFCLKNGVKTSGKVVYFMATFPYLILISLLARGLTLDGYMAGVKFYIIPKWDRLLDVAVWRDASTQILYSLGPGFGSLLMMASYNPFKHNCHRDAILVSLINCGTSVFAGFVIFSVLGYLAHITNQHIEDVAVDGPGLVFMVYPEAIARMPVAPLWAFLFFFMLVCLGLDSQFAMVESIISAIIDEFPTTLRTKRSQYTFTIHILGFALGLAMVTKGGIWVLTLMEGYSASYSLMFVCFCELIAVSWIYGLRRFCDDIEMMLGFQPSIYWKAMWLVISPLFILAMVILSLVQYKPAYYGDYEFESWAQKVGWGMVALPVAAILLGLPIQTIRYGSVIKAAKAVPKWGPASTEHRTNKYAVLNEGFEYDNITMTTQTLNNGYFTKDGATYYIGNESVTKF
ncbi:sodium-dependent proline transporter-like [Gigantopelta aegis]|uniref:sodium-dependent proline transporter-like n=1 Tax=Gigantopelta aegis TaxID=1735272 RepID=UPI001B88AD4E|nr:sodium-dependent proline transporter-like [Gigantopelta aegis]